MNLFNKKLNSSGLRQRVAINWIIFNRCIHIHYIATLDTWFFAVTYLYRQGLELILKAALYKYNVTQEDILSKMRDGCSCKFRYPINKIGDYFFRRETRYNFKNVGQCFNDINYFFSCVEMQLDNNLDIKMEMEAENWSNMNYDYY